MSTVRSAPLENGGSTRPMHASAAPLAGALMIGFGLPLWILGAKYSLDGWVLGLNIVADVLTLPIRIPPATGWWALTAVLLGVCYSYAEVYVRPRRTMSASTLIATALLMALAHATDVGSTFLAAVTPSADAWPIAQWAARAVWPAGVWALALTYLPEVLLLVGARQFRR